MQDQAETLARERSEEIQLFINKLQTGLTQMPADWHDLRHWLFTAGKIGANEIKLPITLKLMELLEWFTTTLTWSNYEEETEQTATTHSLRNCGVAQDYLGLTGC